MTRSNRAEADRLRETGQALANSRDSPMVRASEDHHGPIIFGRALGSVRGDWVQQSRPGVTRVAGRKSGRRFRQTCASQRTEAALWRLGLAIGVKHASPEKSSVANA